MATETQNRVFVNIVLWFHPDLHVEDQYGLTSIDYASL
jgi:hypothetical protein